MTAAADNDRSLALAKAACRLAAKYRVQPSRVVVYGERDEVLFQLVLPFPFFLSVVQEREEEE